MFRMYPERFTKMISHPPQPSLFKTAFGTERQCRRFLFRQKWPNGFECPKCQHRRAQERQGGRRWVCGRKGCTYWESPTKGTLAESLKKPLRLWFWGMWLYAHARGGMTASRLQTELGLGSYQTAWTWCHQFRIALQGDRVWSKAMAWNPEATPFTEGKSSLAGAHAWRGGQMGLLAGLDSGFGASGPRHAFRLWLLTLNQGRSSTKHGFAYWAEHLFWVRFRSPQRRWAEIVRQVAKPPAPYWRLLRRTSPSRVLNPATVRPDPTTPERRA